MKRLAFTLLLFVITTSLSFAKLAAPGKPVVQPAEIVKSQSSFLTYWGTHVMFGEKFVSFNQTGKMINRLAFLKALTSGKYLPLRLAGSNDELQYQLYPLKGAKNAKLGQIVTAYTRLDYSNALLEDKPIPQFKFSDLNGKVYTNANTKGKVLVLKCWFIRCHNCVLEMPDLNKLVAHYKNRKDVVFVSLAIDDAKPLRDFLAKKQFSYPVVANQESFMQNKLGISAYPTHFIIDKKGIIAKVVNDADALSSALTHF